jgi:GxxExxY protein
VKKAMTKTKEEIEQIAEQVVDAVLKVHRALGPGLQESTYQACLAHELRCRGIEVGCEVALPVRYGGIEIEAGYRIDMLVAECIIIENKSVQTLPSIHEAQLLTYLKLSGHRLGFLVNWNVPLIKDGIKRMVNGL